RSDKPRSYPTLTADLHWLHLPVYAWTVREEGCPTGRFCSSTSVLRCKSAQRVHLHHLDRSRGQPYISRPAPTRLHHVRGSCSSSPASCTTSQKLAWDREAVSRWEAMLR